ncbi:MAG: tripartite tricarboxylate transporter TctB family protein [Burkholderiaceae bacterium]
MHSADRLSGLFFLLLGAVFYWMVIPAQTEMVDYGWVLPQTLPNLTAILIAACGASLLIRPPPAEQPPPGINPSPARAGLALGILLAGVWLIGQIGFMLAAPPLALSVMLLIGERRKRWLALGTLGMPALIWFAVAVLLERPLP